MDKFEFEKVMHENGDTTKTMAVFLDISPTSFYNKKNESGTEFTKKEIAMMSKRWKLSPEMIHKIFFA